MIWVLGGLLLGYHISLAKDKRTKKLYTLEKGDKQYKVHANCVKSLIMLGMIDFNKDKTEFVLTEEGIIAAFNRLNTKDVKLALVEKD